MRQLFPVEHFLLLRAKVRVLSASMGIEPLPLVLDRYLVMFAWLEIFARMLMLVLAFNASRHILFVRWC